MISIGRLKPARHDSSLVSDHLSSSQLPVWTIYAEKICVPTTSQLKCEASWAFEMVSGENISKRSEREIGNIDNFWQLNQPAQSILSRKIFFIVTDQTQRLSLSARMCQKMFSFLFQLSGVISESPWHFLTLLTAGPALPPRPAGGGQQDGAKFNAKPIQNNEINAEI